MFLISTGNGVLDGLLFILLVALIIGLIIYLITFVMAIPVYKASFVRPKEFIKGKKSRKWAPYKEIIENNWKEIDELEKEDVFINGYKNKRIHGTFIKSKTGSKKVILFSHGWKNTGLNDYACAGMYYHKLGYNVLVIDHFGHGESSGKHITFGFFDRHNIKKWVDFINDRFNNDCKIFMHGLSMGSSIVTWSCDDELNNVCGIIADSGFCEGYELAKHIVRKQIKFFPDLVLFNTRVICRIFARFDIKKCNTSDALKKSKYPILFMHGDKDDFVPTKHSIISYDKCTGRKEIVIFDDCEHIISCLRHPEKYKEVVIKFIEKY